MDSFFFSPDISTWIIPWHSNGCVFSFSCIVLLHHLVSASKVCVARDTYCSDPLTPLKRYLCSVLLNLSKYVSCSIRFICAYCHSIVDRVPEYATYALVYFLILMWIHTVATVERHLPFQSHPCHLQKILLLRLSMSLFIPRKFLGFILPLLLKYLFLFI